MKTGTCHASWIVSRSFCCASFAGVMKMEEPVDGVVFKKEQFFTEY